MRNGLRFGRAVAVVAAAAAATALPTPGSATAAAKAATTHHRVHTFADKCLDVRGSSTADDTLIIQYRCTHGPNQTFTFG
jgi:hypothetical protein